MSDVLQHYIKITLNSVQCKRELWQKQSRLPSAKSRRSAMRDSLYTKMADMYRTRTLWQPPFVSGRPGCHYAQFPGWLRRSRAAALTQRSRTVPRQLHRHCTFTATYGGALRGRCSVTKARSTLSSLYLTSILRHFPPVLRQATVGWHGYVSPMKSKQWPWEAVKSSCGMRARLQEMTCVTAVKRRLLTASEEKHL